MTAIDLAVVVVSWNTRELTLQALHSLIDDLKTSGLNYAIYVVDNASSDGTSEAISTAFPDIYLITSNTNLGFVKANNLALRAIGFDSGQADLQVLPQAVYLLNPDTITQPGATRTLYDTLMSDPEFGLAGARLTFGDGSFQHSAFGFPGLFQLWGELFPIPGRFYESRLNGRYPRELYAAGQPFDVDCVLGATMMLRRDVVVATGIFDERYFMFCEEIDWAWRIYQSGYKVLCVPQAHVIHLSGQSTGQVRPQTVVRLWTSRLLLFQKFYSAWKFFLVKRLVVLGMRRQLRNLDGASQDADAMADAYQQVIALAQNA
ncbi:MAG: glycosyltransferase family 2 protein [Anaerolineae bacterium]|nr:glycosyltransferase family 2 protein [Anaerolineae bacterium]